jgi:hypothetical protein
MGDCFPDWRRFVRSCFPSRAQEVLKTVEYATEYLLKQDFRFHLIWKP